METKLKAWRFAELRERFLRRLRSSIEPDAAIWEDERAFAASLDASLAAVLQRAVDPAFQGRQHVRFGGQPFEAFASRLLSVGGATHGVAELRFKSMDTAQPFVELPCFSCAAPAQMIELGRQLAGMLSLELCWLFPDRMQQAVIINASGRLSERRARFRAGVVPGFVHLLLEANPRRRERRLLELTSTLPPAEKKRLRGARPAHRRRVTGAPRRGHQPAPGGRAFLATSTRGRASAPAISRVQERRPRQPRV